MARRPPGKSETLTIRLDPKSRFMLEFVSRLRGQTITTVVERAIAMAADAAVIEDTDFAGDKVTRSWRYYWDVVDGVRALRIAGEPVLHPTYEEERRLAFAKRHWPFFYTSADAVRPMTAMVEILWPRIDEFLEINDSHRSDDYFAAGKAMQLALREANVQPPDWPPAPKERKPSAAPAFEKGGIDDDIPF